MSLRTWDDVRRLCEKGEQFYKGLEGPQNLIPDIGSCNHPCIDIKGCLCFCLFFMLIFFQKTLSFIFWRIPCGSP